jgi:chromosome segregation protein
MGEIFEEDPGTMAESFADLPPLSDEERQEEHRALSRLEERISDLGAVNMLAREEYAELTKRFEFLSTQRADLEESVASLQETIRKINRTTRERFMEAFEAVQMHFSHLFKEVFEGGEARLSLLDEANPLDTGVEIYAQPPGKKLQNLQLLSGGEKAMVALALLFSLFRYRPQPFFILDEVDAPLDEANINRFNRLLTQFRGQTQFVVVSHNKRTMEMAEVLYGVTMAEGGVSRVVSVRLADVDERLAAGGTG